MGQIDDGRRMRRVKPRRTPAVETCLAQYQEMLRRMDAKEDFFLLMRELGARLECLTLGEQKVYYETLIHWRAERAKATGRDQLTLDDA